MTAAPKSNNGHQDLPDKRPSKMGRPSLYSPKLAYAFLDRVRSGRSVRNVCKDKDMPDRRTIDRWCNRYPSFAAKYKQAIELRLMDQFESLEDIEEKTLNGEYDPKAASVTIGSRQWRLAKLRPKQFGDKQQIEHTGKDGGPIEHRDTTDELVGLLKGGRKYVENESGSENSDES